MVYTRKITGAEAAAEESAAAAKAGDKKKKWTKGKVKEKLNNLVLMDKATYDKLLKEIPKAKLVTPSVVSERLKVNGSIARASIRHLEEKGLIHHVGGRHHAQLIYTRKIGGE